MKWEKYEDDNILLFIQKYILVWNYQNMNHILWSAHKSDVVTGKISKSVAEHFNEPTYLRFQPFEIIHSNDPTLLASRESYWIAKKKVLHGGLNRQK